MTAAKYPARAHCAKTVAHFQGPVPAAIFLSGEALKLHPYLDQTAVLRQNRYFYYLSGVDIPGSHLLYETAPERLTLYLPAIDYDDVMWSGMPTSVDEALAQFDVDQVKYAADIESDLALVEGEIHTIDISEWSEPYKQHLTAGSKGLFHGLDEARLTKDAFEIGLMRKAAAISDKLHLAVMLAMPITANEGHLHAEFIYHSMRQGSKFQLYDPICCAGPHASTLHYVANDGEITTQELVLIDAGAEWHNYASDVTRCFPINGKFSKEHREVYETVLDMQAQTMALMKPGTHWDSLHLLAHKICAEHLLAMGVLKGVSAEEAVAKNLTVGFFPHGLGHLLGLDTHDVGGRPNYDDADPKLRYLRLRRPLQEGMVVTNEPGLYFNPFLLKDTLESEHVDQKVLEKYWAVGGVRIEDDIVITATGYENLTGVTSKIDEVERIVQEGLKRGKMLLVESW